MEFENPLLGGDFEDPSAGKIGCWKTTDDSIWVSLDFPRVCMETLITTTTNTKVGGKSISLDTQSWDPVFKSEMFSCVLENARRKLEEAIAVSCKRPCCIEPSFGLEESGPPEAAAGVLAPWDSTASDLGFRSLRQGLEISEVLLEVPVRGGGGPRFSTATAQGMQGGSITGQSYFTEDNSLWLSREKNNSDDGSDSGAPGGGPSGRPEAEIPPGSPPEGLFYVLPFLLLKDLLVVEQVCKAMKETVSTDTLLWRHLRVDAPLSSKLTDEALLSLAARSQGRLESLVLVDCLRISEEAVEKVVMANPMISKILLPGCIMINVDAVVRMAEFLAKGKLQGRPGLQQVRIRGLSGLTKDNLNQLLRILGLDQQQQQRNLRPHFYSQGNVDERPIDILSCPRCSEPRPVYDCTREECRNWEALKLPECRACIFCIGRCEDCGTCLHRTDFEETFCLRILCRDCWLRLPKCLECNKPGRESGSDRFIRTDVMFVCPECQGDQGNRFVVH